VGEATPTYLADPEARRRIAETLPDARLIAILRNPVDRAYSQYWMARSLGTEDRSFEAAIGLTASEPDARPLRRYLEHGHYVDQLRDLAARHPRGAIHVAIFEDFVEAPEAAFRAVCRFLDVDDAIVPDVVGTTVNAHVDHRSGSLHRAAKDLPRPLRRAIGRLNARAESYPPMDPATRVELLGRFREPNDALAAWLGRDLTGWGV
jgi:hypothetical protein